MIKKNISINFCGRLYNIDEDAYELIKRYTETIRRHFSKQEGGNEIADDIEERIAELFDEEKAKGKSAIDIETADAIIQRIGNLNELTSNENDEKKKDDNNQAANANSQEQATPRKKLYRDTRGKCLAGVLSGLSQYFGGTVTLWRVLFIIIALFSGIGFAFVVAYIVLAIVIPAAEMPEDRLKMQGKAVNPQNIAEEVAKPYEKGNDISVGKILGITISVIVTIFLLFLAIAILSGSAIAIMSPFKIITSSTVVPTFLQELFEWAYTYENWSAWVCLGAIIISTLIVIFCAIHTLLKLIGKVKPMSTTGRNGCVVAWFIAIVIAIASGVNAGITINKKIVELNTHNGIYYYNDNEWEYFNENGWNLLKAENMTDYRFMSRGEHFNGNPWHEYFDTYSYKKNLIYQAEKQEIKEKGIYKLTASARCSEGGHGAFIYVYTKNGDIITKTLKEIKADGNGYENGELGRGWNKVIIDSINVNEGDTIRYGVTTDQKFTGSRCDAEWFSACDFELTKTDK